MQKTIVLPGNPPAKYFYDAWGAELNAEVIYPAFYPKLENSVEYLQAVTENKAKTIFNSDQADSINIVAHSMGGFYALNLLKTHSEQINKCILVCPFIAEPTLRAKTILKLMFSVHKKPIIENMIIKNRYYFKKIYPDLVYLKEHEFVECMRVGYHEYKAAKHIYTAHKKLPKELASKVKVIYTPKDMWCPEKAMANWMPKIKKISLPSIKHDFVVDPAQRKLTNKHIIKLIG